MICDGIQIIVSSFVLYFGVSSKFIVVEIVGLDASSGVALGVAMFLLDYFYN